MHKYIDYSILQQLGSTSLTTQRLLARTEELKYDTLNHFNHICVISAKNTKAYRNSRAILNVNKFNKKNNNR